MISSSVFWRTIISGFIATFVMTMVSLLQGGIGLPTIDIGHILKESFNYVHGEDMYSILWGNSAYYLGGMLMALIWVVFLQHRIPGKWILQGIIFGIIITVVAGAIIAPLTSLAAGDSFGIFYVYTWFPVRVLIAGILMHVSFGISLMVCLKVAGVKELSSDYN